jgi:hypothetical protein
MPRYTRTKAIRKQEASAHQAWARALHRIRRELSAEWQSGQTKSPDTVAVIRAAEQWRLKVKFRRELRREQQRQRRRVPKVAA